MCVEFEFEKKTKKKLNKKINHFKMNDEIIRMMIS